MAEEGYEEVKESKLMTMYKPSGKKMQVNEESAVHAEKMGWTKAKPKADK